ncbi:MAG: hypothetical protein CXZ00_04650 [Acidobacteria bacterium]|nr:MAG: hypothetical protein CXZ00_04650 [Acidobacteriota bacterium]
MFGFGFNKEKSRANAERYLQQNKLQNAISEYEKILKVEPRDLAILNTVGDIYSRLGQNGKAIERFQVVGEAYLAEGHVVKAIAMYRKIVKLDPNGLPAMEKLAELYRKQGLVADARSVLLQAADAYTRKGQSKETLRLLKQLVLFDPENVQVITRAADLMVQGNQKNEAKEMLSQTASTLVDRHALEPARKILDRLIALDRTNLRAQELRAQVSFEQGDFEKAVELYEAIPDLDSRASGLQNLLSAYLKLDNLDAALLTCRKLISVHHDAAGVLKVADRFLKEEDTLRALSLYNDYSSEVLACDREDVLAHLHGAVSRVRTDPDALQTLYNLFQRAGESSIIAEVLELLAHACVQNDQFERARDAYKELIELEPENASHLQGYRQVCTRLSPDAAPTSAADAKSEAEPRTLERFLTSNEPVLPRQDHSPQLEEQISSALAEAEVCDSFSSKERGIAALEAALLNAPDDLRLNRMLALLFTQQGESPKAARCYSTMQAVLENLGQSEAAAYYAKLASSQQTHGEAEGSEVTVTEFELSATPADEIGSTEEIDLSAEWESVWLDSPAEVAAPESSAASPTQPPAAPDENISDLLEEARFCIAQQIWAEAESALARLAVACPEHPDLPALRDQLPKDRPASLPAVSPVDSPLAPQLSQFEVIEVSDDLQTLSVRPCIEPPTVPASPAALVATPTLNSLAAELDAELGESFVPAPQPRRETPVPAPCSSAPVPVPERSFVFEDGELFVQPPAPPPQELVPDIAAVAELQAAEPQAEVSNIFGDLLEDFERELADPENDASDPETMFNLGIAFREMGLLDEAIGELQKVCRMAIEGKGLSPSQAQQAFVWLATCFVEKSVPEASFNWYILALERAPDQESRTAITYELASAYEAAGLKREAYERFMQVFANNIDYRDIASRICKLRATLD